MCAKSQALILFSLAAAEITTFNHCGLSCALVQVPARRSRRKCRGQAPRTPMVALHNASRQRVRSIR